MDQWRIDVPAGTAIGKIGIPVVLTIEGFVAPGSVSGFNRYFDYALAVRDLYSAPIPDPPFHAMFGTYGSVTATGTFRETVTGFVNFNYYGPGAALPTMAEVTMTLGMPGLQEGLVDFGHTASIALVLPPGYAAYTSSGLLLDFAPPVPEPGSLAMLLAGAGVVALAARRRRLLIRAAN
ncbi:PEP-CTERM sorting domain-containing protein [Massilia buxea]|nr:PEP-CTERM sorting domain-containing protein [Pseudoduganella buxea]